MNAPEARVRGALRTMVTPAGEHRLVDEFWIPQWDARADLAVCTAERIDGYEIKTPNDTLKRLPWQVQAYGDMFDTCTAVVARKYLTKVGKLVPEWWGLMAIDERGGEVQILIERETQANPKVDLRVMLKVLWKAERVLAILQLGVEVPYLAGVGSFEMVDHLIRGASEDDLRRAFRATMLARERNREGFLAAERSARRALKARGHRKPTWQEKVAEFEERTGIRFAQTKLL